MKSKRFLLPLLVTLCLFAGCSDDGPATDPADEPIAITESELKEAFYYTFPLMIMDATESVETNAETFVPGHTARAGQSAYPCREDGRCIEQVGGDT